MKEALIFFSGGFDSVAVAHKLIKSGKYEKLTLLFNDSSVFADTQDHALGLFKILEKIAKNNGVELIFKVIETNVPSFSKEGHVDRTFFSRDICLTCHLTLLWNLGQYEDIYLGWNKSNIPTLDNAKRLWKTYNELTKGNINIYWLEDIFLLDFKVEKRYHDATYIEGQTKREVIRYLLHNNLFSLCTTGEGIREGQHWYDEGEPKWREVLDALISLDFTARELSLILRNKDLHYVQKLWDKKYKPERDNDIVIEEAESDVSYFDPEQNMILLTGNENGHLVIGEEVNDPLFEAFNSNEDIRKKQL